MTPAIPKLQAPGFIHQAHAEKFQQGGRSVYSFTLDLVSLNRILPIRVNETITKDANRPLYPAHAKEIAEYLLIPNPPKRWAVAMTQRMMGKGRRTGLA